MHFPGTRVCSRRRSKAWQAERTAPPVDARPDASPAPTARGLSLRELVEVLRDLRLQAGLSTESGHISVRSDNDKRVDLELVLSH